MNDVGFRIKTLRQKRNVSQKEFSKRVCVSQSYLSRIETGNEQPTDMLIRLIALEFNCSLGWLQKNEGEMEIDAYDYWDRPSAEKLNYGAISDTIDLLSLLRNRKEAGQFIFVSTVIQLLIYLLELDNQSKATLIMEEFSSFAAEFQSVISSLEKNEYNPLKLNNLIGVSQEIVEELRILYQSK